MIPGGAFHSLMLSIHSLCSFVPASDAPNHARILSVARVRVACCCVIPAWNVSAGVLLLAVSSAVLGITGANVE